MANELLREVGSLDLPKSHLKHSPGTDARIEHEGTGLSKSSCTMDSPTFHGCLGRLALARSSSDFGKKNHVELENRGR